MRNRLALLTLCLFGFSFAEEPISCQNPVGLVEGMADELREALIPACAHQSKEEVKEVIRSVVLPHIDIRFIVKQVLGRKYWFDATKDQQDRLEELIEALMVNQYAVAFNCRFLGGEVVFYPLREEVSKYVRVVSSVEFNGEDTMVIKYALKCTGEDWKLYDFVVNGLSLGQTYRSQFGRILKAQGPQGLINFLEKELDK